MRAMFRRDRVGPLTVAAIFAGSGITHLVKPAAFDSLMAPDGTHEDIALAFLGKGPAGAKQFMNTGISMEPDFVWKITKVVEEGPMAAAQWTWTATYTGPDPMGRQVKNLHITGRGTAVVEVENGKIKRILDY